MKSFTDMIQGKSWPFSPQEEKCLQSVDDEETVGSHSSSPTRRLLGHVDNSEEKEASPAGRSASLGGSIRLKPPRLIPRTGSNGKIEIQESPRVKPCSPSPRKRSSGSGSLAYLTFEDSFMSMTIDDSSLESPVRLSPKLPDLAQTISQSFAISETLKSVPTFSSLKLKSKYHTMIDESYCPSLVEQYELVEEMTLDVEEKENGQITTDEGYQEEVDVSWHKQELTNQFDLFSVADFTEAGDDITTMTPGSGYGTPRSSSFALISTHSYTTPSSSSLLSSIAHSLQSEMRAAFVATPQQFMSDLQSLYSLAPLTLSSSASRQTDSISSTVGIGTIDKLRISGYLSQTTCDVGDIIPIKFVPDLNDICTCKEPFAKNTPGNSVLDTQELGAAFKASKFFEKLAQCEKLVPEIFFSPDFDLSNAKTYKAVLEMLKEKSELDTKNNPELFTSSIDMANVSEKPGTESRQTRRNNCKKAKLSKSIAVLDQANSPLHQFWDSVEGSLREQVSKRSNDYFMENANFRELELLVAHAHAEIKGIQGELSNLAQFGVIEPLSVPNMAHQRECLRHISNVLSKISRLVERKQVIRRLLKAQEYKNALEQIFELHQVLAGCEQDGFSDASYNLSNACSLEQLREDLVAYETEAVECLSNQVVEVFVSWRESVCIAVDELENGEESSSPDTAITRHEVDPSARDHVLSLLKTIQDANVLPLANQRYITRLKEVVYLTVKTIVTECAADSTDLQKAMDQNPSLSLLELSGDITTTPSVAAEIRTMSFNEFFDCTAILFEEILNVLRLAGEVNTFLEKEGIFLAGDRGLSQRPEISALHSSSDFSQRLISELFEMRGHTLSTMSLSEMKRFYDMCSAHAVRLGKVTGKMPSIFLSCLSAQVRAFIDCTSVSHVAKLEAALDDENWVPFHLSHERLKALNAFTSPSLKTERSSESKESKSTPAVRISIVKSVLYLVDCIQWNLDCASYFQEFTRTLTNKVAQILSLFNSRTMKLIVGGGALRSSGRLKSIKMAHLASALSSVNYVSNALPNMKNKLASKVASEMGASHDSLIEFLKVQFDRLENDYLTNISKIIDKVVAGVRLVAQHKLTPLLHETDFDSRAVQFPSSDINIRACEFFNDFYTSIIEVHNVTVGRVCSSQFQRLFTQIFEFIDQELPVIIVMTASLAPSSTSTSAQTEPKTRLSKGTNGLNITNQNEAANETKSQFVLPKTKEGKRRMVVELVWLTTKINQLEGVRQHTFTLATVLGRKLGIIKRNNRHGNANIKSKLKAKRKKVDSSSIDSDSETLSTASIDSLPRDLISFMPGMENLKSALDEFLESGSVAPDSISDVGSTMSDRSGLQLCEEDEL